MPKTINSNDILDNSANKKRYLLLIYNKIIFIYL